jgi:hypothetical protein
MQTDGVPPNEQILNSMSVKRFEELSVIGCERLVLHKTVSSTLRWQRAVAVETG